MRKFTSPHLHDKYRPMSWSRFTNCEWRCATSYPKSGCLVCAGDWDFSFFQMSRFPCVSLRRTHARWAGWRLATFVFWINYFVPFRSHRLRSCGPWAEALCQGCCLAFLLFQLVILFFYILNNCNEKILIYFIFG